MTPNEKAAFIAGMAMSITCDRFNYDSIKAGRKLSELWGLDGSRVEDFGTLVLADPKARKAIVSTKKNIN